MNIEMKRGDDLALDVTRLDENGNAVDLTGMTITSQAKYPGFSANLGVTVTNAVKLNH